MATVKKVYFIVPKLVCNCIDLYPGLTHIPPRGIIASYEKGSQEESHS